MLRLFSTEHHRDWWKNRKIDWKTSYLDTYNHPHRQWLVQQLRDISFSSIFEVGCGPGANLMAIKKANPHVAVGGADINPEAIDLAIRTFPPFPMSVFELASADSLIMSDASADVGLSDMTMIYVGPTSIKRYLTELIRISRRNVVLVEFYHPSLWKRIQMTLAGRYTHNYPKLLEKLGCSDISVRKLPNHLWPGAKDNEFRYLITART